MRTNMSAVTVNTIDLCALSELNDVFKYADDTTLLVPEHTDTELEVEFNRIKAWAAANCLHLNLSKTKEVVFRQPRITYFHLLPAVGDIEQVNCCKLLGVIFSLILNGLACTLHHLPVCSAYVSA